MLSEAKLSFDFADESTVRRLCEQRGAQVIDAQYAECVSPHIKNQIDRIPGTARMGFHSRGKLAIRLARSSKD